MKNRSKILLGAALLCSAALLIPETAMAQSHRSGMKSSQRTPSRSASHNVRGGSSQSRHARGSGVSGSGHGRNNSRTVGGNNATLGDGSLLRQFAGNNNPQLGDGSLLRELAGGNGRLGDGRLLRELAGGGYDSPAKYRYKAEEAHADAYRDAAIANAVVGLVGIIAESATANRRPVYAAPVQVAPSGHYETQRVIVQQERYEAREVWVPEQRNTRTGEIIDGHYEVHKRLVPAVYQETQVWVPHGY